MFLIIKYGFYDHFYYLGVVGILVKKASNQNFGLAPVWFRCIQLAMNKQPTICLLGSNKEYTNKINV